MSTLTTTATDFRRNIFRYLDRLNDESLKIFVKRHGEIVAKITAYQDNTEKLPSKSHQNHSHTN